MSYRNLGALLLLVASLAGGLLFSGASQAQSAARVFELRTYTTNDGKLNDLVNRFRDHTVRIFARHGMVSVGYWIPKDQPNTLIYILAHPNREAANQNWDAFRKDPEWVTARTASEANGTILAKPPVSVYMDPTAFSAIK
jgi:hypothetical protein